MAVAYKYVYIFVLAQNYHKGEPEHKTATSKYQSMTYHNILALTFFLVMV